MRLVLDIHVVASALPWSGLPRVLLQAAREKRIELFGSAALPAELAGILKRGKFEKKLAASGLTIGRIVCGYSDLVTLVQPVPIEPTILADPDGNRMLACALAARADFIVSGDRHWLHLKSFQDIPIVAVSLAVSSLGSQRRSQ